MSIRTPLYRILVVNAVFSGVSGLLMLLFARDLGALFGGPPSWLLPTVGVGLLGFAGQIAWSLRAPGPRSGAVLYFSLSDLAWVLGSGAVCASGVVTRPTAVVLVAAVGAVVLSFCVLQLRYRHLAAQ